MKPWIQHIVDLIPGEKIHCGGMIPENLEVFQDHFPDFPVLPGVLALDILRESVDRCVAEGKPEINVAQRLVSVQAVKFQHFLRPGEFWESLAVYSRGASAGIWNVKLMVRNQTAVSARMLFSSMLESVTEV